ncbi:importin subunit beta-5 [[Candida] anglica]|uniref:Importin subunit beta-5 n=1 Tax=[Candida] anglica TaxID=148631 RepID=A0ABP0EK24_9ASCO
MQGPQKDILDLVIGQNSPNNNVRTGAELRFNEVVAQDPTAAAYTLIQIAVDEQNFPIDIRQSCLLHLKRCVPKYWSGGFRSFVGPPIQQELKEAIRSNLLQLATSSSSSKIRNGAGYVIVQIAAADFPDEWPNLLNSLYESTTRYDDQLSVIGGLTVLNDLFDDLISEEQFWEGGVGTELINHITQLLGRESLSAETKTHCIILYQNVVNTLQSPEAFATEQRKEAVRHHINESVRIFLILLETSYKQHSVAHTSFELTDLYFRGHLYKILGTFLSNFNKRVDINYKKTLLRLTLQDFNFTSKLYDDVAVSSSKTFNYKTTSDLNEPKETITFMISELLSTLTVLQQSVGIGAHEPGFFNQFIRDLLTCTVLPKDSIEDYELDFNVYVTRITGLSAVNTTRDSVNEFLAELNQADVQEITQRVVEQVTSTSISSSSSSWQLKESYFFVLESVFMNEDAEDLCPNIPLVELMNTFATFISYDTHYLLSSRCFLMLPKFFEKFSSKLKISDFAGSWFIKMIQFIMEHQDRDEEDSEVFRLAKVSVLVCATYYQNLLSLKNVIPQGNASEVQLAIFQIVFSLLEDSEEDTLPVLLEAITVASGISHTDAVKAVLHGQTTVIDLILKISFKAPADIQLTIDAAECLRTILEEISVDDYLKCCESSLPVIFNIIENALTKNVIEYTPELDLALELLGIVIDSATDSTPFPDQIFNFTFPVLQKLLLLCTEDQILQTGGQVFNNLIQKGDRILLEYNDSETNQSGLDIVLAITSKFLSPELSDSAALNSGSIILSVIEKFSSLLGNNFLSQILEATVRRLLIAKEVVTTENLMTVFCKLVLSSPEDMINFLSENIKLPDTQTGELKNGLELVLPIWFSSFEVIRGYEQIKQNTLAIAKLFTLGDSRVESIIVNGDIIPYSGNTIRTRSMEREMPDQYTQISASLKILKLLVSELNFQYQQPDASDYLPEENELGGSEAEDGGDDGWEDMDDIGVPNYEKLKSYVDSDIEDDEHDDQNGSEDLKNILAQFFKMCTTKNLGNFQVYYEQLDDEERKIITENVVFN